MANPIWRLLVWGKFTIGYVAQAIIAHTQWGMDIQQAINQAHALNRFGTLDIEQGTSKELARTRKDGI